MLPLKLSVAGDASSEHAILHLLEIGKYCIFHFFTLAFCASAPSWSSNMFLFKDVPGHFLIPPYLAWGVSSFLTPLTVLLCLGTLTPFLFILS